MSLTLNIRGNTVEIPNEFIKFFKTLSNMCEDCEDEGSNTIQLESDDVHPESIEYILEYWKNHPPVENFKSNSCEDLYSLKDYEKEFGNVKLDLLFNILTTSNYLDCEQISELLKKIITNMISSKSPEQIKMIFGDGSDFSEEEINTAYEAHPFLRQSDEGGSK